MEITPRVVIVDDDELYTAYGSRILQRLHLDEERVTLCDTFKNAREVLTGLASTTKPTIVFMDGQIDGDNTAGKQLLAIIAGNPHIVTVGMSSLLHEHDTDETLDKNNFSKTFEAAFNKAKKILVGKP